MAAASPVGQGFVGLRVTDASRVSRLFGWHKPEQQTYPHHAKTESLFEKWESLPSGNSLLSERDYICCRRELRPLTQGASSTHRFFG